MPRFTYEALNNDGQTLAGALTAAEEREAARLLEKRGLRVLAVAPAAGERAGTRRRLQPSDVTLAIQELATMLMSGVPVADAVGSQALSGHHPRVAAAFARIARELQRGQPLSSTLAGAGLPLPEYAIQLAKAGEMTGELGQALDDAARQMEYENALRTEVRNALIYPAVLVTAGVGAVALMFLFVVPRFSSLLARADDLPLLAWAVLGIGTWARAHLLALLAAIAGLAVAAVAALRRPGLRARALDRMARLPIVGDWLVEADAARWSKMMAALLANRVPLLRALELAQAGVGIPHRAVRLGEVTRAVRGGQALADALESHDALTPTGYNLVRVGERSGKLPAMLGSLATLYAEAGRVRMKRLLILLEPVAILLIGGVIGTIILGVILAITSANDLAV